MYSEDEILIFYIGGGTCIASRLKPPVSTCDKGLFSHIA